MGVRFDYNQRGGLTVDRDSLHASEGYKRQVEALKQLSDGGAVMGEKNVWPDYVMLRDTHLSDDVGGMGQRIYTTAGFGYEKRKYIRADLAEAHLTQPAQAVDVGRDRFALNDRVQFDNGKHVFDGYVHRIEYPHTIYYVQLDDGCEYACYGDDPKVTLNAALSGKQP